MNIYTDIRELKAEAEGKIGGFKANPGKFEQLRLSCGNSSGILIKDNGADFFNIFGFTTIKAGGVDELLEALGRQSRHSLGGGCFIEQAAGGGRCHSIFGAKRDNSGY